MAVQVSLNTSANPPVTVNPQVHDVNQGNQTVKWERANNQTFTFASLSGLPSPPFGASPTISDSEMSITDNNPGTDTYYAYTITVNYNGQQYSSSPSQPRITDQNSGPTVHNK